MPDNHGQFREEAYTNQYYDQRRRVTESGSARMLLCFCIDISRSMGFILNGYIEGQDFRYTTTHRRTVDGSSNVGSVEPLRGRTLLTRIDKLIDILCHMINELKRQRDLADSVAVCITTFSEYADVIQEFQDLRNISETALSRQINLGADSTNMAKGLAFAEREIKSQRNILDQAQIDTYTPMLVVMSDGLPTDSYEADNKRDALRELSDDGKLNMVPVFIGNDSAGQRYLRSMTKEGTLYTMSTEAEYNHVFEIIRTSISNSLEYSVVDNPYQMAQAVPTESQTAIDTTYCVSEAAQSMSNGLTLEELMEQAR